MNPRAGNAGPETGNTTAAQEIAESRQNGAPAPSPARSKRARSPRPDGGAAHHAGGSPGSGEPILHLRALANELNGVIAECLKDPDVEPVHRVRTGSRRVEAMLETVIRLGGPPSVQEHLNTHAGKWFRQLRKVRRAAGKVRDLDVHRHLLRKHYLDSSADGAGSSGPDAAAGAEPGPLHKQATELDAWLKCQRERQAARLVKELARRQTKLISAEQKCIDELGEKVGRSRNAAPPAARLALEDFLRLVDAMPVLNAENLHDFRKGAKKARYVAESGGEDQEAKAIAKAINRVQDAIGDWHDFLVLASEAKSALGKSGAELRAAMDAEVEALFRRAISTTDAVRRRLVGEWVARGGSRTGVRGQKRAPQAQPPAGA